MKRDLRWIVATPLMVVLLLSACGEAPSDEHVPSEAFRLEAIEGTELSRVILTARGAERVGIETAAVSTAGGRKTVPADAVFFDVDGDEWVYTNPEPLVFVRAAITVDRFKEDVAVLSEGPPAGTRVVTVGVSE